MIQIIDCEQGSERWFLARCGIPTSSEFHTVMAKGKAAGSESVTRARYMRKLAGELITGEPSPEGYTNAYMDRGKALEDDARRLYAFMSDADPIQVGFIRNGDKGGSPDSLIGDNGGLEIKVAIPEVQIERLMRGTLPSEHRAQVQGNLWVSEREFWDFVSYCPKLPLLNIRVYRDEEYIAELGRAVEAFNAELHEMVETIRRFADPDKLKRDLRNSFVDQFVNGNG